MPSDHSEQTDMALGGLCGQPGTSLELWVLGLEVCGGLTQKRNEGNGLQLLSGQWLAPQKPSQIFYYSLVKRTSFSCAKAGILLY